MKIQSKQINSKYMNYQPGIVIVKSLLLVLVMFSGGISYGQSIKDMAEQAGIISEDQVKDIQNKTGANTPAVIPAEIPEPTSIAVKTLVAAQPDITYYGYDYFSKRSELILLDNLPAPAKYVLGPGDEIIVTMWGETELRETGTISRDGSIYFENIGLVRLAGLSFSQSEKKLKARFERAYSTLRGGSSASTFLEVSLGALKSINVHFLGEVNAPGILPIHPFSTVTTALIQASGISEIGTLRDIRIIRNGKLLTTLDLYSYLQSGTISSDIRLLDNDIISVPVRHSSIQIRGKVRKPGIFELIEGETLADLIRFAGGLEHDAGDKVEINRILPPAFRTDKGEDVTNLWTNLKDMENIQLIDGDKVNILPLFTSDQAVLVQGSVKNPGSYSLSTDMRVADLLDLSGGIFDKDFWERVYPYRADLIRSDRLDIKSQIIPIKLDKLKAGDQSQNIKLEVGDKLIIYPADINNYAKVVKIYGDVRKPGEYNLDDNMGLTDLILRAGGFSFSAYPAEVSINSINPFNINNETLSTEKKVRVEPSMFNSYPELDDYKLKNLDQVFVRKYPEYQIQRNISLDGEIMLPGMYALEKKGETLGSVIQRAGGFTDEAFIEGLKVLRNEKRLILRRKGRNTVNLELPLRPGDEVFIPKHANTVEILGEVNSSGLVQFNKGLSVRDYINIAGSFTLDADKGNIAIYYPNGESKSRFLWMDPKVREGSVIVVYKKGAELPLDKTTYLSDITAIVIQSLSLLIVANKLASN